MDEAEDTKCAIDNFVAKLFTFLGSDDMDMAAQESLLAAEILDLMIFNRSEDNVLDDLVLWYSEIMTWMNINVVEEANIPERYIGVKRDDRTVEVARNATYKSFELVMQELRQPSAHRYFSARRTIKSLSKRVLAHFDFFCENLLIANSLDATVLRNYIRKAADIAKKFISLQKDQIQFPEDKLDIYDERVLSSLGTIMWNSGSEDIGTKMQNATQSLDDDLVGLGSDLIKIKERLTGTLPKLEIVPIVGMGGIGKTTLARRVYEDPQIMFHFHVHAWVVVSQEYNERNILLGLLQSIASLPEDVLKEDKEQLAERLYRRLKGWRYFIVIDDIWTTEAWDQIKLCFPDDSNGSRIMLTTRVGKVASHVSPENPPHFMSFLSLEDSWDLLHKQVYGRKACPPQLVNLGKQIVEKCQGLPLAIKVVAGHLSNISNTQECWGDVANRVGMPTEVTHIESLFNIFSLSYNDLPHHLKACFLSMLTFPKNSNISVGKLIKFWTAMGFLPPKLPNNVEEVDKEVVAIRCFEDLIGRSLVIVRKRTFDGKVKLCGIHDLLWDLSMTEARKDGNFIFCDTYLCHSYFNTNDGNKYAMGLTHSLLYFDQSFESDCPLSSAEFKLLKVLDIANQSFDNFPYEIMDLVNLRYLALATSCNIPNTVSKLCSLETLINNHKNAGPILPEEIWLLACLRHLRIGTCVYLAEPTNADSMGINNVFALLDLQTLSNLSITSCTKEVFSKIPNLKKLGIHETREEDEEDELLFRSLNNLVCFRQLEILKLCCYTELDRPRRIPEWNSFLPNIKQLTLIGSNLPWSEMKALAMLPNLEVLKLKENAFVGKEWEMEDEEFLHLKFLLLESLHLVIWKSYTENFPRLQCLVIRECIDSGIPCCIGSISTLKLIDLEYCNSMAVHLAKQVQRVQMEMGNDTFILRIGHLAPQGQPDILATTFVYMTLRLKMSWAKSDRRRRRKGKDTVSRREVLASDCLSNPSFAGLGDK